MIPAALLHPATAEAFLERYGGLTAGGWDESEHPRHPKGTPVEGGRFAPKGEEVFVSEPEDWSTVLSRQAEMERLWRDQTNLAYAQHGASADDDAVTAKIAVQDRIAAKLEGDKDFASLIAVLDPTGDWTAEFGPGGSMSTAKTVEQQTAALAVKNWATSSSDTDPIALQFQLAAEEEFGLERSPYVDKAWNDYLERVSNANNGEQLSSLSKRTLQLEQVFTEQQMRGARKFLRAQYELTQQMFKDAGITEVYAYRGMRFDGLDSLVPPPAEIVTSLSEANARYDADNEAWMAAARRDPSDDNLRKIGRAPRQQDYAGQDIMSIHQNPLSSWAHSFHPANTFSGGGVVGAVAGTRIDVRRILSTPFTGFGCLDEDEMVVLGGTDMDAMVWSWDSSHWRPESDQDFQEQWMSAATRDYEARRVARAAQR